MRRQRLIAVALVVCATIVVVAVAITRHVNNKQDAEWCYDHGYANYATQDGFCVGAGGQTHKSWPPLAPKKWARRTLRSLEHETRPIAERAWHQFLKHGWPMHRPRRCGLNGSLPSWA